MGVEVVVVRLEGILHHSDEPPAFLQVPCHVRARPGHSGGQARQGTRGSSNSSSSRLLCLDGKLLSVTVSALLCGLTALTDDRGEEVVALRGRTQQAQRERVSPPRDVYVRPFSFPVRPLPFAPLLRLKKPKLHAFPLRVHDPMNVAGCAPLWLCSIHKKRNLQEMLNAAPDSRRAGLGENDLEAKYKRSILDIAILQDHIAVQCESVRKVQSDRTDLRTRVRDMEQKLQHERQDHRDVNSDLSRQYKTMQTELTNKVKRLETEVSQLKEELVLCQDRLKTEKREREQMEQEKDATIADLKHKLDNMETDYERILHVSCNTYKKLETLDSMTSQLSVAQQGWEDKGTTLHKNYEELLSEFGLNAMDI
ncbi:hypothetical protein L3Q82_018828 [Scortum barcoo]|uniref:Uncharacterized protein n=1 Tax=Scortum barcoo TaxID=214431 RepID=A0ACB8VF99_9TELE|nr:hypothetical protein L3Q82_018828 [Scortum barcoo]